MRKRWLSVVWTHSILAINADPTDSGAKVLCPKIDLLHLQDASDSFRQKHGDANIRTLMSDVLKFATHERQFREDFEKTDFRFGVASFVDKPYGLAGMHKGHLGSDENDWEYKLIESFQSEIRSSFAEKFDYGAGGDPKESQLSAIKGALLDSALKWRGGKDTTRIIALVTNSDFHAKGDLAESRDLYEQAWNSGELCDLLGKKVTECEKPNKLSISQKTTLFGGKEFEGKKPEDYPSIDDIVRILDEHDTYLIVFIVEASKIDKDSWSERIRRTGSQRFMLVGENSFDSLALKMVSKIAQIKDCEIDDSHPIPPNPSVIITRPAVSEITKVSHEDGKKKDDETIDPKTNKKTDKGDDHHHKDPDVDPQPSKKTDKGDDHHHKDPDVEPQPSKKTDKGDDNKDPNVEPLPKFDKDYESPSTTTTTTTPPTPEPAPPYQGPAPKGGMGKGAVAGAAVGASVGAVAIGGAIMKGLGGSIFGQSSVPNVTQAAEASGQNPQMERETLEAIDADMFA